MAENAAVEALLYREINSPNDPSSSALRKRNEAGFPMPFAALDLSVLAYANGFTLWHCRAGNVPLDRVKAQDFFGDVSDMMAAGDLIMISGGGAGALITVSHADAGSVTVTAVL